MSRHHFYSAIESRYQHGIASLSNTSGLLLLFLAYVVARSLLRYRRRDGMAKRFNYRRHSLGSMTPNDAHAITKSLTELEFPTLFSTSVFFALFKVCNCIFLLRCLSAPSSSLPLLRPWCRLMAYHPYRGYYATQASWPVPRRRRNAQLIRVSSSRKSCLTSPHPSGRLTALHA